MATVRGEATAKVGGTIRQLRFNMETLAEIEEKFDKPIQVLFPASEEDENGKKKDRPIQLRYLLFTAMVCLRQFDKTMTLKKLSNSLEPSEIKPLFDSVGEALNKVTSAISVADKEEEKEEEAEQPPPPEG